MSSQTTTMLLVLVGCCCVSAVTAGGLWAGNVFCDTSKPGDQAVGMNCAAVYESSPAPKSPAPAPAPKSPAPAPAPGPAPGPAPTAATALSQYTLVSGVNNNIDGFDVGAGYTYTTDETCAAGCSITPTCQSFVFNPSSSGLGGSYGTNKCSFKSSKTAMNSMGTNKLYTKK
jgi:hypothetical protein